MFNLLTAVFLSLSTAHAMTCADIFDATSNVVYLTDYMKNDWVSQVKAGVTVEFSDGAKFQIKKIISIEGNDGIYEVENNQVLRIPKYSRGTIDQYIDGYPALVNAGIPVPHILQYVRSERILVEKIDVQYHLEDIFLKKSDFSPQQIEKLKTEFMEFVAKFRDFNKVGDFHASQIVYARDRGWMLLDWRDTHQNGNNVNPFSNVWKSIERLAIKDDASLDRIFLHEWSVDSDRAIAAARDIHRTTKD